MTDKVVYMKKSPLIFDLIYQSLVLAMVIGPFLGVIVAMWEVWGLIASWASVLGMIVTYMVISWGGVTLGLHRYFTHGGFRTYWVVKVILIFLAHFAVEGKVRRWVADHIAHHQNSDQEGDPHRPGEYKNLFLGFIHAHLGWFFSREKVDVKTYAPKRIYNDRTIKFLDRFFFVNVFLSFYLPYYFLGWEGFIWVGLVRIFLVHHVTWSVNSICHIWGEQPHETGDKSRNVAILAIPTGGESYHNNHHWDPASIRHASMSAPRWHDITYELAKLFESCGLIWDLKEPNRPAALRRAEKAA